MPAIHAAKLLRVPSMPSTGPIVAAVGDERRLKQAAIAAIARGVLGEEEEQLGLARHAGEGLELRTVVDELLTISMWGDQRLVVVEEADKFVSEYREGIERYLQKPAKKSVLLLDVKSWPKTTRLAKRVATIGLEVDCSPLSTGELSKWLVDTAREQFGKKLEGPAAALIVELVGDDLGLAEQEVAKLASYVGARAAINAEDVRTLVGGWRTETTWAIAAAVRQGKPGEAITLLDGLLAVGEAPQKIQGGMASVFRRLAQAVERSREGVAIEQAIREAGVYPREAGESAAYLKRLPREAAQSIYRRLLEADGNLKGASEMDERAALEKLIVELSATR